ncbi:hypothetical protein [Streptomyces sp. NPDC000410]|uniref:hypothetical protein n=1 Tax=Streptomyces sp. NPDC000410 TaxID=3154254 RepID=UPI00331D346C
MRLLRRLAALVTLLALTVGAALFLAPGAAAGGPTSVLVVSPESGEATGIYSSAAEYRELEALLGTGSSGETDPPPSLDEMTGPRQINVTWMLHDITPWRLDHVYPSDDGNSVWIHTADELPESYDGLWHKATKPTDLILLLKKLGVMGKKSGALGNEGIPPQASWERPASPEPQAAAAAAGAGASTDWWWAIPGLAAGAVLALAVRPLAARLPRPPFGGRGGGGPDPGPRQQLLDL